MELIAKLKEDFTQTVEFFKELSPQMIRAKELVSKWSIHQEFKYQCHA